MLDGNLEAQARAALSRFLCRNYEEDQKRLNKLLALPGRATAGLIEDMSPLPFAGHPFDPALRGRCIALLGINPKWLGWDHPVHGPKEYRPLRDYINTLRDDKTALDGFLRFRARYFTRENDFYYGRYYTKLGGLIGNRWFGDLIKLYSDPKSRAISVFRTHVFKADILPWFSMDTAGIDARRLPSDDDALSDYKLVLRAFLRLVRPRWIQFNGLQALPLIEGVLATTLRPHTVLIGGGHMTCCLGWCSNPEITDKPLPVLVHGFTNSAAGPQSQDKFNAIADAFERWVDDPRRFDFH